MIQQIRIQNFRSLKDVTLDLQQVNLLIGPNNSGKTNVLKALSFLGGFLNGTLKIDPEDFNRNTFLKKEINVLSSESDLIGFSLSMQDSDAKHFYDVKFMDINKYSGIIGMIYNNYENINLFDLQEVDSFVTQVPSNSPWIRYNRFTHKGFENSIGIATETPQVLLKTALDLINSTFKSPVYNLAPQKFTSSAKLISAKHLNADGSNIVPFLFSLGQNYKKRFRQLEADLERCVGDIIGISTPPDPVEEGKLKLKFFDAFDNDYWADEVSEGVLYFLAILCIIHQPDPPKLLLLEEPERGIHPRRIREVIDFIFDLAQEKDIQVIMTTHDTYVVDQFADIPEAVFVFDKKDGATQVKNLQKDIIEPADKLSEENGLPPTNYTRSLGEHWAAGFLGGVPR